MNVEDLKARVAAIAEDIRRLNADLAVAPLNELRKADLQVRYAFGGAGSPWPGAGTKPIIPVNEEHSKAKAFATDIDYACYREKLRAQRVPEPQVWDRFPPQTPAEQQDMTERLAFYVRAREKARQADNMSPYDMFLLKTAKAEAKLAGTTAAAILEDPGFRALAEVLWQITGGK